MIMNKASQRGITLTGLLMGGIVISLLALLGMKVAPDVIEYGKVKSNMKALAGDASLREATVAEVRKAFDKRADVDQIRDVKGSDLDITKQGNSLVLSVAYTKRIALFGPVSLLIDFEGSTAK
jgi:Tfp pilus assembly protein FimT